MTVHPPNAIPPSRARPGTWPSAHHARDDGVWPISHKKGNGKARFEYAEVVEEALCFRWVDSKPNKLDEERSIIWFAPCKAGSGWSKLNKARVEPLIAEKRMAPAGLAKVEQVKKDDLWSALDAVEAMDVPADLAAVSLHYPPASENLALFPRSAKRGILEWIGNAKTVPTREKRILETAQPAPANVRANLWHK